jgi:S-adenosylmethionine synthetase
MNYLFTSESVSEGHPDKVADLISDSILDLVMKHEDTSMRCACETLVTTDKVILAGEYKGILNPEEVENTVRSTIKNIGYEQSGFNWRTVDITNLLHGQSEDIALGTDNFGAGDQGLMFGYACNETKNYMPAAINYSHQIMQHLTSLRKNGQTELGPDSKAQVTLEYDDRNNIIGIRKIVCSTQHREDVKIEHVREIVEGAIRNLISEVNLKNTEFLINPTGRFVIGGPDGDTGLTGRKIIVDTYGGSSPHGGGAFSGKDPTKVDRSAAYMARYLAKNIVYNWAYSTPMFATVQLAYAIGVAEPISVSVKVNGQEDQHLSNWISKNVDLTPKGIIDKFKLFRPIYTQTTNYGHFGKTELPWESLDLF